MEEREEI